MSRWTRNGRGSRPAGDGRSGGSDPDTPAGASPTPGDLPADRLREPRAADRFVRGRTRLTVRELMEQMNTAGDTGASAVGGSQGPSSDDSPTQAIPSTRSRIRRSRGGQPPTPTPAAANPAPDEQPTRAHPVAGNDVTQKIPPVTDGAPGVDLSDRATRRRVTEESRAQETHTSESSAADTPISSPPAVTSAPATPETPAAPSPDSAGPGAPESHDRAPEPPAPADAADEETPSETSSAAAPPMQPTPDLTLATRSRPHRVTAHANRRSLTRNVTITGRVLVSIACVMALVGTGFVWGYLKSWNGNWRTIVAVDPDDSNIRNKDAQYGDENYLIVGTDTRAGKNSKVGAGTTADAEGARSDTVILINVPADRSRVVAVSFPRDLQVDRPQCQEWDNANGSYGAPLASETQVKLNSVYAFGGPQCLVRVITQMSGLNINHFIAMDFYGFEKVVNAVGGVDVCSTVPLYDYELGNILKKPGKQKLTGRRALNYVRARTVSTEGNGDYGRIKRQQLFMSSLLRSTLSTNVLSSPSKLNSIVNTFIQYSFVDGVDTQSLLKLAESMQGIEAGRVTFITIPTTGTSTDGANNELPNTEDIDAIFNAVIDDQPLPGEQSRKKATPSSTSHPAAAPSAPAVPARISATAQNPGNVGVRVLNGTGRVGAASDVSDQLTAQGFDVRGVADASQNRTDTVIRYGVGEQASAATLAAMFPGAPIQLDRTVRSGAEVILGSGFGGTVSQTEAVGTTLSVEQIPPATNSGELPNDLAITNAGDTTCS